MARGVTETVSLPKRRRGGSRNHKKTGPRWTALARGGGYRSRAYRPTEGLTLSVPRNHRSNGAPCLPTQRRSLPRSTSLAWTAFLAFAARTRALAPSRRAVSEGPRELPHVPWRARSIALFVP